MTKHFVLWIFFNLAALLYISLSVTTASVQQMQWANGTDEKILSKLLHYHIQPIMLDTPVLREWMWAYFVSLQIWGKQGQRRERQLWPPASPLQGCSSQQGSDWFNAWDVMLSEMTQSWRLTFTLYLIVSYRSLLYECYPLRCSVRMLRPHCFYTFTTDLSSRLLSALRPSRLGTVSLSGWKTSFTIWRVCYIHMPAARA